MTRSTRAIIYLRQSEDRAGQRAGVDRQLEDCRKLCEREKWDIVRVITDNDVSASRRKPRPGYRDLLADVEHGATDVVVAWAQDRLLRDVREGEDLIDLVERTGVRIATVRGGDHDLSTPDGRMHVRLLAVIAKGEVEKKADRQRRQQRQAAEKGEAAGRRAFGYRVEVTHDEDGQEVRRWVEHPAEAAIVRDAFDRLLNKGQSVSEITQAMNESGLRTAAQGKPWSRRAVRYMLLSSRYCGVREYRRGKADAIVVNGTWPKLISVEDHEKAVKLLTDPVRKTTVGNARKWIGSGLYLCGCEQCKGAQTVRAANRNDGVRSYVCRSFRLTRKADPVDKMVLAFVEGYLARPDGPARLLGGDDVPEIAELRAERDRLQAKIDRAVRDYDDEVIDGATLKAVKARREAELRVVERKIAAAARTSQMAALGAAPDPVAAFRELGLNLQRQVIDSLVSVTLLAAKPGRVTFDPDTVRIEMR